MVGWFQTDPERFAAALATTRRLECCSVQIGQVLVFSTMPTLCFCALSRQLTRREWMRGTSDVERRSVVMSKSQRWTGLREAESLSFVQVQAPDGTKPVLSCPCHSRPLATVAPPSNRRTPSARGFTPTPILQQTSVGTVGRVTHPFCEALQ